MQIEATTFPVLEPNQNILHKAYFAEQICLVLAIQIVLINLLSRIFGVLTNLLPAAMLHMGIFSSLAVLSATLALFCSEGRRDRHIYIAGKVLAALTTLTAAVTFFGPATQAFADFDHFLNRVQASQGRGPTHVVALAFMLMGIVIFLLGSRDSLFGSLADAGATILVLLVLIVLFEHAFAITGIPGATTVGLPSIPTLVCVALLTLVCIFRRAEYGVFSVFLGDGIGGRIARIVAPILLFLPFLRELGRARLLSAHVIPMPYAIAILTAIATLVSFAFLLLLVRLINKMQTEIHGLTLRDGLTGLYNFRGFYLFADQAYRWPAVPGFHSACCSSTWTT
jgi:hypothetical protein